MTPNEQSRKLYKLFMNAVGGSIYSWEKEIMWNYDVKKCCHIAVDEMLNEYPAQCPEDSYEKERHLYWMEVKQEIEKL